MTVTNEYVPLFISILVFLYLNIRNHILLSPAKKAKEGEKYCPRSRSFRFFNWSLKHYNTTVPLEIHG